VCLRDARAVEYGAHSSSPALGSLRILEDGRRVSQRRADVATVRDGRVVVVSHRFYYDTPIWPPSWASAPDGGTPTTSCGSIRG
jgi:ketosteroid isomerase-like protein